MKKKLSILLIPGLLLVFSGYGQDSVRTKNDKPGTPQSLRTIDNAPQSHVHIINPNSTPNQTINHGALESGKIENAKEQINVRVIPQTSSATVNNVTGRADSVSSNIINNRKSNTTNPIRK